MRHSFHRPKTITPLRSTKASVAIRQKTPSKPTGPVTITTANGDQSTTTNPFAKKKRNGFVPRIRPIEGPVSDEKAASLFRPDFFVDPTMIRTMVKAVVDQEITVAELGPVYHLAFLISKVQGRKHVTNTDLEGAIEVRTQERLKAIGDGTVKMGELRSILPAPRNVHEIRWRKIASTIIEYQQTPEYIKSQEAKAAKK
jgi:hypothetical protein